MLFPETMTPWSRLYTRATLERVVNAADMIVTPSTDTANDVSRHFRISPERLRVVWNGVDQVFFSAPEQERPLADPYVRVVGTPEPRKNLPRLMDAMRMLNERGLPHRLVIAGGGGWGNVAIDQRSSHVTGRVGDRELLSLYAHADCLALPSLHEGFVLPAVEAMAAGTPVVAGNRGALPEVVGNAGVLVDPYDAGAIASGLERAISAREQLVPLGRARAAQFTWERAAESMSAIYRELA